MAKGLEKLGSNAVLATVISLGALAPNIAEAGKPDLCVQADTPEKQMLHTKYGKDGMADGEGGVEEKLNEWRKQAGVQSYNKIPDINKKIDIACGLDCSQDRPAEYEVPTTLIPMDKRTGENGKVLDIDFCRQAFQNVIHEEPSRDPKNPKKQNETPEGTPTGDNEDGAGGEGGDTLTCEDTLEKGECQIQEVLKNEDGSVGVKIFNPTSTQTEDCWDEYICFTTTEYVASGEPDVECDTEEGCCEGVKAELKKIKDRMDAVEGEVAGILSGKATECESGNEWGNFFNNKLGSPTGALSGALLLLLGIALGRRKEKKNTSVPASGANKGGDDTSGNEHIS